MIPLGVGGMPRGVQPSALPRCGESVRDRFGCPRCVESVDMATGIHLPRPRNHSGATRSQRTRTPGWPAQSGQSVQDRGNLAEAMTATTRALSLKPEYATATTIISQLSLITIRQDPGSDRSLGKKRWRIKPGFADAALQPGRRLVRLGRLQEAIGHYELAPGSKTRRLPRRKTISAQPWPRSAGSMRGITHCEEALR